ncbi:hypothetical protein [Segniliparus rugosus]|uniref:Uncharacterized protein n=1 Tax=Segniliparus rugosus (strain ATCC BAA-974 / DSM 45345 / CCUG 50838 / CIP 108380 / JCM 13579 / CDC 945) TaxID=679197 RepID=E5XMU2_SEGRC|nr:hypothetical protein [Segniliparus rugosus]EFV14362.1 hypothetical protein HMPREF9336_00812 [Segniliparus rugosus ATCC BAA-974]
MEDASGPDREDIGARIGELMLIAADLRAVLRLVETGDLGTGDLERDRELFFRVRARTRDEGIREALELAGKLSSSADGLREEVIEAAFAKGLNNHAIGKLVGLHHQLVSRRRKDAAVRRLPMGPTTRGARKED